MAPRPSPASRTIRDTYTRGLLTGVGTPGDSDKYASISYHPNVTIAEILHGNGVRDALAEDPTGLPRPAGVEVRTGATTGDGTLWQAGYAYDGTGNLVTRSSLEKTNAGAVLYNLADQFRYDNVFNRLVSSTMHYPAGSTGQADTRGFSYDPYGNLTAVTGSHARTLATDPATNRLRSPFTYDPAGNLTSQPKWDATGNPTSPTAWYYTYDPFNKMTRARNAAGTITRQYLYTADGERLATISPGRELWTLRGPDNQVLRDLEHLSTGWRWVEDYVYRGSGLLASISNTGNPATSERHYHLDHLGSPRLVTDSLKQVVARHVLAPYGEELTFRGQDELRLKFTGHERDALDLGGSEDDLDYLHARFCSPQLGRFLGIDRFDLPSLQPGSRQDVRRFREYLGMPQSWNRYAYSKNSPQDYVDPDGNEATAAVLTTGAYLLGEGGTGVGAGAVATGAAITTVAAVGSGVLAAGTGVTIGTLLRKIPGVDEAIHVVTDPVADFIVLRNTTAPGRGRPAPTAVPGAKPKTTPVPDRRAADRDDPKQPPAGEDIVDAGKKKPRHKLWELLGEVLGGFRK